MRIPGPFDGDAATTHVTIGGREVPIVAESPRGLVTGVPEDLPVGPTEVVVEENGKRTRFPVAVVRLKMGADRLTLLRGESTRFQVIVEGLNGIPDSAWKGGPDPEFVDRAALERVAPGFKVPAASQDGFFLLIIENASRDTITLGNRDERMQFTIPRSAVSPQGTWSYLGVIRSVKDGTFNVQGSLFAFVAPARGE